MSNADLIAAFGTRFKREVPGSSLSPQLNRLARDGLIQRDPKGWIRRLT